MSRQSPSVFPPRRRWLAVSFLVVALVAVGAGAQSAHLFGPDSHPDTVAATHPANGVTAQSSPSATASATASAPASATASGPTSTSNPTSGPVVSPAVPTPQVSTKATDRLDPGTWSNRRLAAILVMTGAKMDEAGAIQHAAERGVAGVVLFAPSSPSLARTLSKARALAPRGNPLLIASDEEGGLVQRLSSLIYRLPSAEVMGRWGPARITATARDYAMRMRALGVNVALGPDADLAVPGYFIARDHRSFSEDPRQVSVDVNAWNDGLEAGGVLGVVKHWPGHGQASDTHKNGSTVPSWSVLQRRDLVPFNAAFAHRAGAVMVGHLRVPGLTEGVLPASESRLALSVLRAQAGVQTLIVTDDLNMAAASTALGISPAQAAVRSLVAGADIAMVCSTPVDTVISAVAKAIDSGRLPRQQAVISARRTLLAKTHLAVPR